MHSRSFKKQAGSPASDIFIRMAEVLTDRLID